MIPGDTISRYRILSQLGQGGGGVVYRAEDTLLNRPVALKFLPADALTDNDKQRLLNEARAAAQVRHPNICPVYDVEEADGQLFIAMACLDGETLSKKTSRGPLGIQEAVEIAIQIASGLERAHEAGIVHRDIKSSNIVVGPDGHVYLLDFGLALFSGAARITAAGHTVGTPAYMSPEQADGRTVDHRTDIWSMGVVLYEMLTGKLPFGGGGGVQMFRAILSEDPPPVSSLRAGVPVELQRVVETALAKRSERRWPTARAMETQLRAVPRTALADSSPDAITRTVRMPTQSTPPASRKNAWLAATALALIAFATYPLLQEKQPAAPLPAVKQLAVLPFEAIGSSEVARTTADGLVEVLTTTLAELGQSQGKMLVIPSSEIRRRKIGSAEEARRMYGATLALTGSAQVSGDVVLFTLNLVDTVKLRFVGKTFEYDPKDPIASRNGAMDVVARLLQMELDLAARRELTAGDSSNPSAYAAYLQGLGYLARFDVASNKDRAIASLEAAVRLDPTFALAFARLGEAYWRKAQQTSDATLAAKAVSTAERALSLQPNIATVHASLGAIYNATGRQEDGLRELRKALTIDPSHAEAQRQIATVLSSLGRREEAEAAYRNATRSRPSDWYAHFLLAVFYGRQARYKEAEASLRTAEKLTPDNEVIQQSLGALYQRQGRYAESMEVLQRSLNLKPNDSTFGTYGATLYYLQRFPEAAAAARSAIQLDPNRHSYWGNLG
ncbi:MAG TPA: protein kinase, partial [Bryobacteraceae bacterium]|nr:protein kinase [Bryobacteraceae bacterium]